MMFSLLIVSVTILLAGLILLYLYVKVRKKFGVLTGQRIYQDTEVVPGKILYATSVPLCGKPDYILEEADGLIPVEVKTGRTPKSVYLNHSMQLMAYCLLVEEHFGVRPKGGIVKYPHAEFRLEYTKEAEKSLRRLIHEVLSAKENGTEFDCTHTEHNR